MRWAFSLILLLSLSLLLGCSDDETITGGDDDGQASFLDQDYIVLAWNDLGMHCLNEHYDSLVVLPPYNNLWAQVIQRGDPPVIVISGVTVEFEIENNTSSADKRTYGEFWDNAVELFGGIFGIASLDTDIGLTGTALAGEMEPAVDHYVAEGIPVVPVDDDGVWDPYQVAVITVKNDLDSVIAQTKCTIPASDEMNCAKCHGSSPDTDILEEHAEESWPTIFAHIPVLCAECHGSPAYGQMEEGISGKFLSEAIHGHHATTGATCYDCHPGANTQCARSLEHTAADGNCTTCHGSLAMVAGSIELGRIPWVEEPACADCHSNTIPEVATGTTLYRNAMGHGDLYCAACHGSPHAMVPAREASDNYQARQYQVYGIVKTIASCGTCHSTSHPSDLDDFVENHGGLSPDQFIGCHACHTRVPQTTTTDWPHSYQWTNSND
jgi:hypothetical protein